MTDGPRRGVTRGYVGGLVVASVIAAMSVIIAVWGGLALWLARDPISSHVPVWVAPILIVTALVLLAWALWRLALILLRGRRSVPWGAVVSLSGGVYLLWCIVGLLTGLSISETWLSPFAAALAPVWGLSALLFWVVLARRVYTDRPVPKWPWEQPPEGDE